MIKIRVEAKGNYLWMQLSFSSKGLDDEQKALMEQINHWYTTSSKDSANWHWKLPYKTKRYVLGKLTQEEISGVLDNCYKEIQSFEKDLQNRLAGE